MKSLRIALVIGALVVSLPAMAADFGVRAGRISDAGDELVGAELLFDLGAFNLNPNIEYSLEDNVTAGTANLDLLFDIAPGSRVQPYLGAGVGMSYRDVDNSTGDAQTDLLGNLIGGLSFNLDFLKPYAQVKYFRVLDSNDNDNGTQDDIALTVGLRF